MPFIGDQATANSKIKKHVFTATGSQTEFAVASNAGDELQVFLNGVLLKLTDDYTYTTSTVTLGSGATVSDIVEVHVYQSFALADAVKASGDTMTGELEVPTVKLSSNVIKASDGGSTITLDDSDNVTIAGDLKVGAVKASDGTAGISIADSTGRITVTETNPTITLGSNTTFPAGMARGVYFGSSDTEVPWSSGATTAVSVACATGRGSGDDCKFLIQGVVRLQTTSGTGIEVSVHRNSDGEIWNGGTSVWDASSNPNGVAFPVLYLDEIAGLIGTVTYYVKIERISGSGAVAINYDDGTHDQKSSISVTEFKK